MIADRQWVCRNLGFDPVAQPAPRSTFAVAAAAKPAASIEDIQREIIDFESEAPTGRCVAASSAGRSSRRINLSNVGKYYGKK